MPEAARSRLIDAEESAGKLATLRTEQARRDVWLRDHSDEVRWADQLWERIEAQHSTERSDRRGRPGTKRRLEVRSPTHRPEVEQCGARSTDRSTIFDRSTVRGDAAIEAGPQAVQPESELVVITATAGARKGRVSGGRGRLARATNDRYRNGNSGAR